MAVGLGQAIALGNLATVSRDKPFTNAVMNRQRFDLADQAQQAKAKQQAQEQQKQLNNLLKFGEGGFTPFYQEQAAQIANQGLQKQIEYRSKGDQINMMSEAAKMKAQLDDLKLQDEATRKFLALKKEGYLIPKELEQGFSGVRSQNEGGIQEFLKKNPQYNNIVKYDPVSKVYSFNPIKDIDLNKAYDTSIRDNESQMTEAKHIRSIDNNTSLYELSLSPQQISTIAASYGTNPEYVNNLKLKEPNKFQTELANTQKAMPEISLDQAESIAAAKIAEENLLTRNKKAHFETKAQPQRPYNDPNANPKNAVNLAVTTTSQDVINPIFGANRPVTTVHISTPLKGENEKSTFEAHTAFINNNGTKQTVSLKGKPISGSVIEIASSPDPKNPNRKEVYAVIESDVLTNKEINPEKYAAVLAKKGNKLTLEEKQLVDEANNKSKQLYYVPLRDVAKNLQAELKRYNQTDIINNIEKAIGIKYSDYTGETTTKSSKPKTVVQNGITYTLNPQTGQYE